MNPWFFLLFFSFFNTAFASLPDLKSFIANKQYAKAVQLGEALIQQHPNSPSALFYTAFAYQNLRQNDQAKKHYLQAINNDARFPEIYNNLASIYVAEKNYTKAADTLTLAINSQKSIATAYANLSKIYRHLASKAYQQVLNDGTRKKYRKTSVNTQLLANIEIDETLAPIQLASASVIKKETKPNIEKPKKPVAIVQNNDIKPSAKESVIRWANAWKTKDFETYINSYSKTYAPKSLTHEQWIEQRKKRISRPGDIIVSVSNFDLKQTDKKVYINFDQVYRSNTYQDKVRKRMHLTLINGQWLITSEVTLSVL